MARPVVLVAWEPRLPEEALAVQERLAPAARVEWIHELSPALARDLLPETVVVLAGTWPPFLTDSLSRMKRLRLVVGVQHELVGLPHEKLKAHGVAVELGIAPGQIGGPLDPAHRVSWARAAAERAAAYLATREPS